MITINNGIIGTFVFRNEGDGCLNAKYMNEEERLPYGETCVLNTRNLVPQNFIGQYSTVWLERNGQHIAANLSIIQNPGNNTGNAQTFFLTWAIDGTTIFSGIGMAFGELLVGSYWG